ncbi:transporter [Yeosuana aromativorans]|uniref:Transporter n=1 Tax=Yeosuana aromativorans TaxID=288019 RepID=A0A8J3BPH3_9FLAO|nr:TolC family protein [Yeosuana aromativorans]GGK25897.1 transporter [Yeosuana aromativorans]
MTSKFLTSLVIVFISISNLKAQQIQPITLEEAVQMALQNSDASKLADTKVLSAQNELNVTKNLQYPDVKLSGQYLYLANANVDLKINTGNNSGSSNTGNNNAPNVHQLLLGQANVSLPLFSGFKLNNTIKASESLYKAADYKSKNDKEQLSLEVINDYLSLYKARQTIILIETNLKSAHQRVVDFSAKEQNGLLARNDLLKAQIQESNIELSLEDAKKNEAILNYRLAMLLKLPEGTKTDIVAPEFGLVSNQPVTDVINRNDLEALRYQEQAAEQQIKVAKSKYFPSLALSGGYIALDLQNALTVTNAMNIGIGVSYNLSDLFKAKSDVRLAKTKTKELQYTINMKTDQIKVDIENAKQDYQLAIKKYHVYTESQIQAEENYRIVKDKYDNGLADTNDLLEADVDQLQAKLNVAYAKAGITQKYYELLAAQGQLNNTLNQQ